MKLDDQWVLMKESKIPRVELNTVHLYQHYSLFMHNKLQYTGRGDYCECVRPAQLPVLTEVRAPSLWNNIHNTFPIGTEQGTAPGSVKGGEYTERLSDYKLLNDSAAWAWFIIRRFRKITKSDY